MKHYLSLSLLIFLLFILFISGCAPNSSSVGIVVSSSIRYSYYYKYLSINIYNASNLPFQVTSVTMRDLNTGETLTFSSISGEWLYPGQTRTSTSDPMSYYIHGSVQITICGNYSNGRKECDSIIVSI